MAELVALLAGLGLVAAGATAATRRSTRWMAAPTVLAGVAWLAPLWVEWPDTPALLRSASLLAAPFLVPTLAHLMLGLPGVQLTTGGRRLLVTLYAAAAAIAMATVLFFDPFLELSCWVGCPRNAFLVVSDPQLTRIVRAAGLWFALGGGAIVAVLAARRLWTATTVGRRVIGPIGLPLAAAAVSQTALAAAVLLDPTGLDRPQYQVALSFAQSASLLGLAAGVGWMLARERRRDTAVARIAEDLAAQPASLQATLARSLGDKNLQVAYRLPGSTLYVDAAGQPFVLQPGPGQIATTLTRAAEPVAVVVHDQALGPRLEQEIGAAARLAIDNERLRSALLWELDNLRASRLRVVEASDETRRALERDLHDGAQQRLLAVTFELRLALDEANASDNEPLVTTLAALVDDAQAALGELRDLAHGIFPAILDQAGLEAALSRLADEAALPVEIAGGPDRRLPADVEQTAYLVAASAVATATQHRAERLRLAVEHHDGRLIIGAMGAGADDQDQLADRVGALGGKLSTTPQRWRAEIPCE